MHLFLKRHHPALQTKKSQQSAALVVFAPQRWIAQRLCQELETRNVESHLHFKTWFIRLLYRLFPSRGVA